MTSLFSKVVLRGLFVIKKTYFNHQAIVWKGKEDWHPFPWCFKIITPDGRELVFAGVPNQMETSAQALKRAWWRCKWLSDGTYNQRYR